MYCRKCGKQMDYDAPVCKECEEMANFFGNGAPIAPTPEKPAPVGSRMEGFGKALTSTIIGVVSFIVVLIAMVLITAAITEDAVYDSYYGYYYSYSNASSMVGVCTALSLICCGAVVVALIFGIQSIKCFIAAKRSGAVKPIATLILGIVGVVMSALTFLYALLTLAMCALV